MKAVTSKSRIQRLRAAFHGITVHSSTIIGCERLVMASPYTHSQSSAARGLLRHHRASIDRLWPHQSISTEKQQTLSSRGLIPRSTKGYRPQAQTCFVSCSFCRPLLPHSDSTTSPASQEHGSSRQS